MAPSCLFFSFVSFGNRLALTWKAEKACMSRTWLAHEYPCRGDVRFLGAMWIVMTELDACCARGKKPWSHGGKPGESQILYGSVLDRSSSTWTINRESKGYWLGWLYFRTGINFWRKLASKYTNWTWRVPYVGILPHLTITNWSTFLKPPSEAT